MWIAGCGSLSRVKLPTTMTATSCAYRAKPSAALVLRKDAVLERTSREDVSVTKAGTVRQAEDDFKFCL